MLIPTESECRLHSLCRYVDNLRPRYSDVMNVVGKHEIISVIQINDYGFSLYQLRHLRKSQVTRVARY